MTILIYTNEVFENQENITSLAAALETEDEIKVEETAKQFSEIENIPFEAATEELLALEEMLAEEESPRRMLEENLSQWGEEDAGEEEKEANEREKMKTSTG